ncbi:DUF4142 domain-containing protein [Flavobacterium hydrophilum]|uniref:DUF4142 domain-containing protein n=1 Tax=Flavobacterium hydrophilum TaxID=2211445 RepID=A0A2V4C6E3_9FLAO|nr:DUF4142 domain-containing protein [Flavobacterium hydrophilum]PXY46557.1 hypothetical protein DMB68_05145 [Flavobacterium hydrophilum]
MSSSKPSFLKTAFIVILTVTISSCNENEKPEKGNNKYVLTNNTEEIEANFFVATASITKSIISKTQLAQLKSLQNSIKLVSTEIENNQSLLLQEINKIATQKLIIITEINTAATNKELYELAGKKEVDFDKEYLNVITNSLSEMIKLFESIAKETNDPVILKLVTHYLPKQYEFLRETEKIKKQIN